MTENRRSQTGFSIGEERWVKKWYINEMFVLMRKNMALFLLFE